MQEHKANPWPFDIDKINKGTFIPAHELEEITGHKCGTQEYSFAILELRDRLHKELKMANKPATVRQMEGGLKVLLDEEAVDYNRSSFRHGARKMRAAHDRTRDIDQEKLSAEQKAIHSRELQLQGHTLFSIRKAMRKKFTLEDMNGGTKKIESS